MGQSVIPRNDNNCPNNDERKLNSPQASTSHERNIVKPRSWNHFSYASEISSPGFAQRISKEVRNKRPSDTLSKFPNGQDKYIHTGMIPNVRLKGRVKPIVSARCPHTTPLLPLSGSSFSNNFLSSSNRMHDLSSVVADLNSLPRVAETINDPTSVQSVVGALQQTHSGRTGTKRFRYMESDEGSKKQKMSTPVIQSTNSPLSGKSPTSIEKRPLDLSSSGSLDGLHVSPENKRRCIVDPRQASLSSAKNIPSNIRMTNLREIPFLCDSHVGSEDSGSTYSHQSDQYLPDQVLENLPRIPTDHSGSLTSASTSVRSGVDTQSSSRATTPTNVSQALNSDNFRAEKVKGRQRLSKMLGMLFNTSDVEDTAGVSESALQSINEVNKLLVNNDASLGIADGTSNKKVESAKSTSYTFKLSPNKLASSSENGNKTDIVKTSLTADSNESKAINNVEGVVLSNNQNNLAVISTSPIVPTSISGSGDKSEVNNFRIVTSTASDVSSPSAVRRLAFTSAPISTVISSVSTSPTAAVSYPLLAGCKTTTVVPLSDTTTVSTATTTTNSSDQLKFTFSNNSHTSPSFTLGQSTLTTSSSTSIPKISDPVVCKTSYLLDSKSNENTNTGLFSFSSNLNKDSKSEDTDKSNLPFTFGSAIPSTDTLNKPSIKDITNSVNTKGLNLTATMGVSSAATVSVAPTFGFIGGGFSFSGNKLTSNTPSTSSTSIINLPETNTTKSGMKDNFSSIGQKSSSSFITEATFGASKSPPTYQMTTSGPDRLFDSSKAPSDGVSTQNKPSPFSKTIATTTNDTLSTDKSSSLFSFKAQGSTEGNEASKYESSPFAISKPITGFGVSGTSSFANISSASNTFSPTNSAPENLKFDFSKSATNTDSSLTTFGSFSSSSSQVPNVSKAPQFGSESTSAPFQFGGKPVDSHSKIQTTSSSSLFGTTLAATQFGSTVGKTTIPQFGNTTGASQLPQFGSKPATTTLGPFGSTSLSTPQFGSAVGPTTSLFDSTAGAMIKPQFGSTTGATIAPQFGSSVGATTAPQFGSTTGTTTVPQFGSTVGATTATPFGSAVGATAPPQFGATAGSTTVPQFGSIAGTATVPQFGSTAGTVTKPQFGSTAGSTSLFGSTGAGPTTSLFGATAPATATSLFGTTTSATTTSLFGNIAGTTTTPQFGSADVPPVKTTEFGSAGGAGTSLQFGSLAAPTTTPQFGATNGVSTFGAGAVSPPQFGSSSVANQMFGSTPVPSFSPGPFNFGGSSVEAGRNNLFSLAGTPAASSPAMARRPRTLTARRRLK